MRDPAWLPEHEGFQHLLFMDIHLIFTSGFQRIKLLFLGTTKGGKWPVSLLYQSLLRHLNKVKGII